MQLTGEKIDNSSASDESAGVFIGSNQAMYRFDADSAGKHVKSGQVDIGTGTTPTLMGSDYVTITGNAEPMEPTEHGKTTMTGLARIDLDAQGCRTFWTNTEESIPTVVTKLSLANGLIYTYTKPKGPANTDAWYFTAIDFATGQTVYKQLAGTGILFNNHYAGLFLGPNGSLYVGVLGGIVSMSDTQ